MTGTDPKPKKKFKFGGLVNPTDELSEKERSVLREGIRNSMQVYGLTKEADNLTNALQVQERNRLAQSTGLGTIKFAEEDAPPAASIDGKDVEVEQTSMNPEVNAINKAPTKAKDIPLPKQEVTSIKQGEKTDYSLGAKDYLKAVTFMPDGVLDFFGVGKPNEPSTLEKVNNLVPDEYKPKAVKEGFTGNADALIQQIVEETEKNNIDDNNYFDLLMKGGGRALIQDTFASLGINLPKNEQLRQDIQRQKRDASKSFIEQLPLINPEVTGELAGYLLQLGVIAKGISEPVVNRIIGSKGQYVDDTLKGAENLFAKVNPGIVGRTQSVGADGIKTLLKEGNAPSKIYTTMLDGFTKRFGTKAGEMFQKYAPRMIRENITFGAPTAIKGLSEVTQGKMEFEDYAKQLLGTSALATAFALNPFNEPLKKTVQKLDDMVSKTKLSGLTQMSKLGVGQEKETAERMLESYLKQNGLTMADAEAIANGKTLKILPESIPQYVSRFAKGLVYDATVPGLASQVPGVLSGDGIDGKQLLHDAVMNTAFRIMHLSGRGEKEARYEKPGFEPKPVPGQLPESKNGEVPIFDPTKGPTAPVFDAAKIKPEEIQKIRDLHTLVEEHNKAVDPKIKQEIETKIEMEEVPIEKTIDGDIEIPGLEEAFEMLDLPVAKPVPDKQINGNRENSKLKDAPKEEKPVVKTEKKKEKLSKTDKSSPVINEDASTEKEVKYQFEGKNNLKGEKYDKLNKESAIDRIIKDEFGTGVSVFSTPDSVIDLMRSTLSRPDNFKGADGDKREEPFREEIRKMQELKTKGFKTIREYAESKLVPATKPKEPLPAPSELPPIDEKKGDDTKKLNEIAERMVTSDMETSILSPEEMKLQKQYPGQIEKLVEQKRIKLKYKAKSYTDIPSTFAVPENYYTDVTYEQKMAAVGKDIPDYLEPNKYSPWHIDKQYTERRKVLETSKTPAEAMERMGFKGSEKALDAKYNELKDIFIPKEKTVEATTTEAPITKEKLRELGKKKKEVVPDGIESRADFISSYIDGSIAELKKAGNWNEFEKNRLEKIRTGSTKSLLKTGKLDAFLEAAWEVRNDLDINAPKKEVPAPIIEKQVEKLVDESKPSETGVPLKEQKGNLLEQLDGVMEIFHKYSDTSREALTKEFPDKEKSSAFLREAFYKDVYDSDGSKILKDLKDAGFNISPQGRLRLDIKGDGVFQIPVDIVDSFAEKIKKKYPTGGQPRSPFKSGNLAENYGEDVNLNVYDSLKKVQQMYDDAKANYETALEDGRKSVIETTNEQLAIEERRLQLAKNTDYKAMAERKQKDADEKKRLSTAKDRGIPESLQDNEKIGILDLMDKYKFEQYADFRPVQDNYEAYDEFANIANGLTVAEYITKFKAENPQYFRKDGETNSKFWDARKRGKFAPKQFQKVIESETRLKGIERRLADPEGKNASKGPASTKYYINEKGAWKEVIGKKVELDLTGDFFAHKDGRNKWKVYEGKSGLHLTESANTLTAAIEKANEVLSRMGEDKLESGINSGVKKTGVSPRYEGAPTEKKTETEKPLPETPKAVEGGKEKTAPETSQSIPIVKKYAKLMAEKQIKSELEGAKERNIEVTKEKLAEATAKTIKQNENQFNKLKDAIDGKDLKKLQDSLHLGNKNWRKFFEEYTGISLGKTMRETKEALKDFVETGTHTSGPKAEDFYITNTDDKGKRTFVKVSGKPVTLKYKGDYFISKPPGSKEFVLSEARTGTAVGRGATKEEAIKAAEHDIEVYGGQKTIDKNIENLISKYGLSPRYDQKPKVEKPYAEIQEEQLRAKIVDATKELRAAEEKLKAIGKHHWQDGLRERAQNDVDEFKENVAKLEKNLLETIKKKESPATPKQENDKTTDYGAVEHIKSLDENEKNNIDGGYKYGNARDRLADIKYELINKPQKAKLTLDVIDFTKKLDNVDSAWENDLGMIATAYSGLDGAETLADYANKLVTNLQNKIAKNEKSAEIQTDKSIKKTLLGYVERDKKELIHLEETIKKEVPGYKEKTAPKPEKNVKTKEIKATKYEQQIGNAKYANYNPDDILPLLKDIDNPDAITSQGFEMMTLPSDASVEAFKQVPIDKIHITDKESNLYNENVNKIKAAIKAGDEIPPIILEFSSVVSKGDDYSFAIYDGHHRFKAYKELGYKEIPAGIITTRDDYSYTTNDKNYKNIFKNSQEPPAPKPEDVKALPEPLNNKYYTLIDGEWKEVNGKKVELIVPGDFFAHKDKKDETGRWHIYEGRSGHSLGDWAKTLSGAVEAANAAIKEYAWPKERYLSLVESTIKKSGLSPRYAQEPTETPAPSKTESIEHFRIGKSPQLYVKVRELPFDAKTDAEGEKYFEVKNETTGEVSTVEQSDLKKVNTRTEEQKAIDSKKATENKIKKLEKQLETETDRFEKVRIQKKIQQLQKVEEKPVKTASAPLPQISPDVPKIKNEQAVQKLEDYGEKIGGAKKDLVRDLSATTESDIINQPLSKSFPEPDYTKLFEDGIINQQGAIFMKFLYDNIPAKPRNAWKVKLWAKKVQTAIDQVKSIVTGDFFKDTDFNEKLQKLQDTAGTWLLREYDTHDKVMKAFNFPENPVNLGNYAIKKYWGREGVTIKNGKFFLSEHPTVEKAVEKLKEILESNKDNKGKKETVFNVFQDRKTKDIFIGKRGATDTVRLVEGFKTAKEAQTYLDGNREAVNAMWEALKVIPEERRLTNRPRVGIDYRKGKNISSEDFGKKFGFRGVEFGNWVDSKERQTHVNEAYDALMDLATVLNVEPEALSLAGELGFAFGARGSGNALAHYEPVKVVINLTKKKGAGSLAHEWWHAMDNYFSRARGDKSKFLTEMPIQKNVIVDGKAAKDTSIRKEMVDAFYGVIDAIRKSGIPERSGKIDATRSKSYWGTDVEMTARSFENFVINKLAETDQLNDYLANFLDMEEWGASSRVGLDNYPYPLKDEAPAINEAYQQLFDAIQTKTDESGKKVLYQLGDKNKYYNSHGQSYTMQDFIDTEVEERENYDIEDVKEWKKKYKIKNTDSVIWVTPDKYQAHQYNLTSDEIDSGEYLQLPDNELEVTEFDSSEGFIIPESDDGDNGFLMVLRNNPKYSLQDIKSDVNVAGMDVLVNKLNKAFPGTEVVFATNKQVLEHLNDKYGTKLSIGEDAPLGFLDTDGKIYINTDRATMNTPIHEFSHLLGEWIEKNKPGLYEQGIMLMRKDAALVREIEDKYGDVYNGSKKMINAEIFAKSVGDKAEKMYSEMPDGPEKQKLIDRFKEWLKKIINRFAQAFSGLRGEPTTKREKAQQLEIDKLTPDSTLEEYLNATGKDLLGGKTIADTRNDVQEAAKYSVGDNIMSEVINGFYSPIEKRIAEFKQEKVSANKWKDIIGKGDEAKYTGVLDWLNSKKPTEILSKSDIMDFMKENRIEVKEVVKSEVPNEIGDKLIIEDAEKNSYTVEGTDITVYIDEENNQFDVSDEGNDFHTGKGGLDEAQDFIDEFLAESLKYNEPKTVDDTKFSSYQTPGEKDNYKEVLITLPREPDKITLTPAEAQELKDLEYQSGMVVSLPPKDQRRLEKLSEKKFKGKVPQSQYFTSGHFDEPNIVVHLRMNTRTDAEGKKVLFLEEIQSDWGQKGRKEGFISEKKVAIEKLAQEYRAVRMGFSKWGRATKAEKDAEYDRIEDAITKNGIKPSEFSDYLRDRGDFTSSPPSLYPKAPFVTDTNAWVKLGLKYALRHAVDEGADKIAWTTGEQQGEQYKESLRQQVSKIFYAPSTEGEYIVDVYGIDNKVIKKIPQQLTLPEIDKLLGKDIASKIANSEGIPDENLDGKVLNTKDLTVGDHGMRDFYGSPKDNNLGIIGKVAESMFGKGSVKTVEFRMHNSDLSREEGVKKFNRWLNNENLNEKGYAEKNYGDKNNRLYQKFIEKYGLDKEEFDTHSVDITPAMRSEVKRGLPLFQLGDKKETEINIEAWKKFGAAVFNKHGELNKGEFKARLLRTINEELIKRGDSALEELPLTDAQVQKVFNAGKEYYKQILEGQKKSAPAAVESEPKTELPKDKVENTAKNEGTTTTPAAETKPVKLKQRRFAKQVLESPDISEEVKKRLKNTSYDPISNKQSWDDAKKMIEKEGVEGAIFEINDNESTYDGRTRNMATVILTKTLSMEATRLTRSAETMMKSGEITTAEGLEMQNEAKKLFEKAASIVDIPQEDLRTGAGQTIQVLSMFKYGTPEGALYHAAKMKKRADKKKTERAKKKKEGAKDEIDKINKETAQKTVKDEKVKKKLDAAEKLAKKVEGGTLKPDPKKTDPIDYMVQTLYDVIKEKGLVPKYEKVTKETLIQLIGKAVKNEKGYEDVWDRAKAIVQKDFKDNAEALEILEEYFAADFENPFSDAQVEKVVKTAIKEKEVNLTELVKKHYTVVDEAKRTLTEKLIQEAGLSEDEAGSLADAIQTKFDELATERKRKMLEGKFKADDGVIKDKKELFDRVIELSNLGALNEKQWTDAFAEYMNTGPITGEQAAKIVELANKVQETPEGFQQDRAITDLYVYIELMNGLDKTDILWALYYPSILSGITTTGRNMISNFESMTVEFLNRNPLEYPKAAAMLARGLYKGMIEASAVMQEGYGQDITRMNKFATGVNQLAMDRYEFPGGKANVANYAKYVSRFLIAQDKLVFNALKEVESFSLSKAVAKKEGLTGKELAVRTQQILGNSADNVEYAKNTARQEGLTGRDFDRRVWELMEQQRPADVIEEANTFALRGTFNYPPKGAVGAAARMVQLLQKNTIGEYGKFVVPFTNIVANVLNNAIDWTPYGLFKRYKWGHSTWKGEDAEPRTKRQKNQTLFRGVVGTALMATLVVGVWNDWWDITTIGTGNFEKNKQLRETGWRPYSVKINGRYYSYIGTPFAIPFIVAGGIGDMIKYRKNWSEQTFLSTVGASVFLSAGAIMDMSFLSGAKDFINIFDENSESKGEAWVQRFLAGTVSAVVPNAVKQISRLFDDNAYDANTLDEMIVRNIGIAQESYGLKPKINVLGEPVKKDGLLESIITGKSAEGNPVWNLIVKNSAWISTPDKNQIISDPKMNFEDRAMTQNEYYDWVKLSGNYIKRVIEGNMEKLNKQSPEEIRDFMKALVHDARKTAKDELFAPQLLNKGDFKFDAGLTMEKVIINNKADKVGLKDFNYVLNDNEKQTGKIDTAHVQKSLLTHVVNLKQGVTDNKISKEYANKELEKANKLLKELNFTEVELLK